MNPNSFMCCLRIETYNTGSLGFCFLFFSFKIRKAIPHYLLFFNILFIVFLLQLPQFFPICPSLPIPPSHSHSQFPHYCPCPWVIHTCSLTSSLPFFPPLSSFSLPPGHCQSVPCFHTCGSILFIRFLL